ncbi:MAG: redoxin domain-containing protein, partial [Myxococcales bacterium]|nr:redoxin domain-containing protein [Myxococcales bacterium]
MALTEGQLAPDFRAMTWEGQELSLSDFEGQPLWLAFFRYASCPLCNLRVHDIIERFDQFSQNGLAIVAVFQSPRESIERYVGKQVPQFPLICDPEEKLYEAYELESSLAAFASPAN